MGYEAQMQADIVALLELFRERVPDLETHAWVVGLASDRDAWERGHDLFSQVRSRNLEAIERKDWVRECQYCFEEACLKSLFNETDTLAPFDSCSPYWVIKNAMVLARALSVPLQALEAIVVPDT